jgi:hypothetical protein
MIKRRNLLTSFGEQYACDGGPAAATAATVDTGCYVLCAESCCNRTNAWKKLINRGDVFAIVVGASVWNDALEIILSNFK